MTEQTPKKSDAQRSEEKARYFDAQLFGLLIRRARMDKGWSTAETFSSAIEKETGLKISRDILYRIEVGKAQPNIEQAIAISLTLRDKTQAECDLFVGLREELSIAVCKKWDNATREYINPNSSVYDEDIPF